MKQSMRRGVVAVSLFLLTLPAIAASRPIIEVEAKHDIRVAYEIKGDVWEAGVPSRFYRVSRLCTMPTRD